MLPAGRGGGQAETESSFALAENVYVILPTPYLLGKFCALAETHNSQIPKFYGATTFLQLDVSTTTHINGN